jgi:rhodanese-related sulfurtransferase
MADAVLRIAAEDALALIESGEAVVIDVREPAEIMASGKVPGAINIPLAAFLAKTDPSSAEREPTLRPEKPVILYCASGKRSDFAGNKLIEFGYREVFNLGGLRDWELAGLPVDDSGI